MSSAIDEASVVTKLYGELVTLPAHRNIMSSTTSVSGDLSSGTSADVARLLAASGEHLSPESQSQILSLGKQSIPPLLTILTSEVLAQATGPGGGRAPIYAARLLGELRATEAIEPMLQVLRDGDGLDYLSSEVMDALKSMGPAALEPLLRVQSTFGGKNRSNPINDILSGLGVRDARILDILLAELKKDPSTGAGNLAEYGDDAALPHLLRALDEYQVTPTDNPLTHHTVIELTAAINELGGELSPAQQIKTRVADEPRRRFAELLTGLLERPQTNGKARPKVGRNDPCPCGSGKKYKKCHLLGKV